jgi:hypothetical protein
MTSESTQVQVARLAGRTGRGSRALRAAAVAGGGLAAASLATASAYAAALIGRPGMQDASAAALARSAFIAGGPVHGAGFRVLDGALGLGLARGQPVRLATRLVRSAALRAC